VKGLSFLGGGFDDASKIESEIFLKGCCALSETSEVLPIVTVENSKGVAMALCDLIQESFL
jgi:hypothetical protein